MSRFTLESKHLSGSRRGFTLLELLVVITVIIVLVALVVPAMSHMRKLAQKAAAKAQLNALQMGLAQYYDQFKRYPDSTTPAYGVTIAAGRGAATLAQGLVGYIEDDGGPTLAADKTTLGFRTTAGAGMGGKIMGPYVPTDPKQYKIWIAGKDEYFIDPWGKEILYYRSNHAVVRPAAPPISKIFNASRNFAYFVTGDCLTGPGGEVNNPEINGTVSFFQLLGVPSTATVADMNDVKGPILGADSYLLISGGPDLKYFTGDDIVVGK